MDTKLLNKYLAGDALPEEKREVVRWMKESEEHRNSTEASSKDCN